MIKLEGISEEFFKDGLIKLTQDPDSTVTLHGKTDGVIVTPWHQAYFEYFEDKQELVFNAVKIRNPKESVVPDFEHNMKELFSPEVKEPESIPIDTRSEVEKLAQDPQPNKPKTTTELIAEKLAAAKPQENT